VIAIIVFAVLACAFAVWKLHGTTVSTTPQMNDAHPLNVFTDPATGFTIEYPVLYFLKAQPAPAGEWNYRTLLTIDDNPDAPQTMLPRALPLQIDIQRQPVSFANGKVFHSVAEFQQSGVPAKLIQGMTNPNGDLVTVNGATTTATSTLYAYDGDHLLATVSQTLENGSATGTSTTQYVHTDNLNSTQATSNENGTLAEYFVYAPYGSVIAATSTDGTISSGRQYIGQFADSSGLSYLNARYYEGSRGQFLSQDPVSLALGNLQQVQQLTSQTQDQLLRDPQKLNSYSYAEDNPIVKKDPEGKSPALIAALATIFAIYDAAQTGVDSYDAFNTDFRYANVTSAQDKFYSTANLALDFTTGGISKVLERAYGITAGVGFDALTAEYSTIQALLNGRSSGPTSSNPYIVVSGSGLNDFQLSGTSSLSPQLLYGYNSSSNSFFTANQFSTANRSSGATASFTGSQIQALGQVGSAFGYSTLTSAQVKAAMDVKAAFSSQK